MKIVKNLVRKNPDKIAKNIHNYFTHTNNISFGIISAYKEAIFKKPQTKSNTIRQKTAMKFVRHIGIDNVLEKLGDVDIDRENRTLLTTTRKILKADFKKLKGAQGKLPGNVFNSKSIYKLSKDFLTRMGSQNPSDFLTNTINQEIPFDKQPIETKEAFWSENFFNNNIAIKTIKPKEINEKMLINCNEVKTAIELMKNNKAADKLNIKNEMLKIKNVSMYSCLTKMFNHKIVEEQIFEENLREVKLVGIPKGKASFRPICITSCIKSIFDSIVLFKLTDWIEEYNIIHKNQIGFMKAQNIYDHIMTVKERIRSANNNIVLAFVDLKKAYNSVERQALYDKLLNYYNIDPTLLLMIQMSIENNFISLGEDKRVVQRGLPQGNRLSPLLFNIFINDIICEYPDYFRTNLFLYADDLTIVTHHPFLMNLMLNKLQTYCEKNFIEINAQKTKIIISENFKDETIKINNESLQIVKDFKYLGISINNKGINMRVNIADCNRIVTLKSIYLRKYLRDNKIHNLGVTVSLIKMFILSNINFFWVLTLENKLSEAKLESIIKRTFKIVLCLNRRFPSIKLEAITLLDDYCNQLRRIAGKFQDRILSHKDSLIKELFITNKNKAMKKLKNIVGQERKSKSSLIKEKQIESFGIQIYDRIPFNTKKCKNIMELIKIINEKSKKLIEEENKIEEIIVENLENSQDIIEEEFTEEYESSLGIIEEEYGEKEEYEDGPKRKRIKRM